METHPSCVFTPLLHNAESPGETTSERGTVPAGLSFWVTHKRPEKRTQNFNTPFPRVRKAPSNRGFIHRQHCPHGKSDLEYSPAIICQTTY